MESELPCKSVKLAVIGAILLALSTGVAWASNSPKSLAPTYRTWLTKDVAYIITNAERDAFLKLTSDDERNKFIERFWEIRNPTPGSPDNPYKIEHYRRLAYADEHFGVPSRGDGWQTDMGRIYITLGEPKQKARYVTQTEVRGMEIWFYSNSHPALPPYFYIIFYEKDFGDFRLYSPYMDGPSKLVTSYEAENGSVAALQVIDRILGREVALTTLSLVPGEPVSIKDGQTSLQSDVMLATIKNLANNPFTIDELNLRKELSESVTHRVVMPSELLNVLAVPFRDAQGNVRLHYALRLGHAEDFGVAQSDDRYYYSIEVAVRVMTPDHKLIFTQERKLARYLKEADMAQVKSKPFGYEGWISLAPGKYHLEFLLSNLLTKSVFPAQRDVTIPEPPQDGFAVTDVVPFSEAETVEPSRAPFLPFTFGGVKFTPYVGNDLSLVPGEDLKVFYQIWAHDASPGKPDDKLSVDYAYGRPGVSGTAQQIHEEIPTEQFDGGGSLINGKKVPTVDLTPGNYRLAITVSDATKHDKRFGSLAFHVVSDQGSQLDAWDIVDDKAAEYLTSGEADYDRGLTFAAAGEAQKAAAWFQKALQRNAGNEKARSKLAGFYFSQGEFAKTLGLYSQVTVDAQTEDETILNVADSWSRTGNPRKAADWVESALKVKPASGPLYLALADYYGKLGETQRAADMEKKGRSLMAASPAVAPTEP
jgi:GWxTD domain-containing protein